VKTKPERILELFKYLWSAMEGQEAFHLEEIAYSDRLIFRVRSHDLMTVYATLYCVPVTTLTKIEAPLTPKGYDLELNYPAFNGSLEEMEPHFKAIQNLTLVAKLLSHSPLIKGEPEPALDCCPDCQQGFACSCEES
jgi:hypothetical protein